MGSLAAAFSPTAYALIASRAVLGLGAAMLIPATLSGIRNAFTEEKQRNFALGLWSTVGGGGAAFGPLVGGFVLEHFHWELYSSLISDHFSRSSYDRDDHS